jgi:hypothetical protein
MSSSFRENNANALPKEGLPNPDSYRDLRWRDFAAAQTRIVWDSLHNWRNFSS